MFTLKNRNLAFLFLAVFLVVKFTGELLQLNISVLLGITFLIGLTQSIFKKKMLLKKYNIYLILYFFLFFLILFSITWSNAYNYGSSKVFILLTIVITYILINKSLIDNFGVFNRYFAVIFGFTIIYILIFESEAFLNLLYGESVYRYRIADGLNSNVISVFFALGTLSFLQLFITEERKVIKLIALLIVIISLFFLFITGSRGCQIGLFGGVFIFYLLVFIKNKKKLFLRILFSISLILLFSSNFLYYLSGFISGPIATFFENRYLYGNVLASINSRQELFLLAIENYWSSESFFNLIFGNGVGSYGFLLNGYDARGYPHNIIFELLYEFGLISVFIFLIITWKIIKDNYKYVNKNNLVKGNWIYLYFYFVLINSLSTGDLAANFLVFCFMFLLIKGTSKN